jgi:DNA-binding NtrC family response regulator
MAAQAEITIASTMALISLLLSRDQQVVGVVRTALEKLAVEVEVCRGARSGCEILSSEKFDAVIVDCDDLQGGLDVLENLRHGESNKNSVTFAILNGKTTTREAFERGAKFVLQKPISLPSAARCFNVALGFMEREQRRYFRHPVQMATLVISKLGQELKATATNLSEGGMAITFRGKWLKGVVSKVSFTLPGEPVLETKAELAWVDGSGHAGIRFSELSPSSRQKLERWLSDR